MSTQIELLQAENNELKKDLGTTKRVITNLCTRLGLLNKNGTAKENISITSLMPILTKAMMNPSSLVNDFSELGELIPLVDKYKDL